MADRRFALGEHHDTELATAALPMAVAVRGGKTAVASWLMHRLARKSPPSSSRPRCVNP